jgi:c(7)-type cytochrome triheme protein
VHSRNPNAKVFAIAGVLLGTGYLGACVTQSQSQGSQSAEGQAAPVEIPADPGAAPVSAEQAKALLEMSGEYLNPIDGGAQSADSGKQLSIPVEGASESPRNDGIHDNVNDAIAILQDPTKAMADFPRDRRQQVDWVAALDEGLIAPRADLYGESQMQTMDLDIVMKNTQYMPYVKFPHLQHTKWLACSNCHPKIFIPKEGANPISMNKVLRGEYCGVCHDKVAFALFICERCHSVPHEESGKWW